MSAYEPYLAKLPTAWWLGRPNYLRYMLRELTCVFIGAYVIALVVGLYRLKQGPAEWADWWQAFVSTPGIVFQAVALAAALYHTVSWFALAPSTMPLWYKGKQVPQRWVQAAHYAAWIAASSAVLWIAGA